MECLTINLCTVVGLHKQQQQQHFLSGGPTQTTTTTTTTLPQWWAYTNNNNTSSVVGLHKQQQQHFLSGGPTQTTTLPQWWVAQQPFHNDHFSGTISPQAFLIREVSTVGDTVDFQLVVQKLRREFTHAQNFLFKIPAQVRACADSRRDFWTTNWKSTVIKCYNREGPRNLIKQQSTSGVHSTPTTATTTIQVYGDHGDFASSAISAQAMLCSYYVKIMEN